MTDDLRNTIEVLAARATSKEDELNKLKRLVNELCHEAGLPNRFSNVSSSTFGHVAIRSDEYYGQTLTAAIRSYLDSRKATNLGAASVDEIFEAVKSGRYKFDTKSDDIARVSLTNALRKSSAIFHRVPSGEYGLLSWYPNAKAKDDTKEEIKEPKQTPSESKDENDAPKSEAKSAPPIAITNREIREVILGINGQFQASDIERQVGLIHPGKLIPATKVANVIFSLKTDHKLVREVSPRVGAKGAVYEKI